MLLWLWKLYEIVFLLSETAGPKVKLKLQKCSSLNAGPEITKE